MRKFTLFLFAAFLSATASMAQLRQHPVANLHCDNQQLMLQQDSKAPQKRLLPAMPLLAPSAGAVITNQPQGELVAYARRGMAWVYTWLGLYYNELSGQAAQVVFGPNDEIYLKDVISQYDCNSWIQGSIGEGSVSFTFPQPVLQQQGYTYYALMMTLDEAQGTYVRASEQTLVLDYDPLTGDITIPAGSPFTTNALIIGLAGADDGWTGFGDWNMTLHKVNETPVVAPEGLETASYAVTAEGFTGTMANVGFQGDDIYVQGIYPSLPEAWVKGTISGDKAVFQNGQYLGIDASTNSFVYLLSAKVVTADDGTMVYTLADDDITFNYDAETKSLTGSSLFLANNGKDNASAAAIYGNAVIQPFIETPATPQTPYDLDLSENGFNDYLRGNGWGILYFSLIPADNQGNYILPEKLSYVLYARVNGEEFPVKLYSADYQYQEEPVMEEIPYNYSDGWDIYIRDRLRTVYYYFIGPEAYGVQAVYRGGGEEHRSDIAWVNVQTIGADIQPEAATPDYPDIDPDDVGSTIKYSPIASGGTRGYFGNWQPQTYDVAMKLQGEELTGTYIQDVIIPLMRIKDISNMKVWLSSQLRLENGQNVPDLMSMDVTPTANGNFTVTLPKPYIIPAEGVYVGFSITINENTYTGTTYPIRTVEEAKETGLYVHSTRDILKWLDLSEGLNKSALIEVNVGGSKVKSNAVSPQDGESIFVRTGNDIKATVTFVNHGGAGVKSLDVEFTLNGNTTEQHIVKNLAATYGVTTQATITLPAINERGNYELKVRVTKVNDVDNEDPQAEAVIPVILMSSEPKHRPLLEEYTGTWCGWCPRGFVALEKLAKLYPDDFVCIAYHNSDPMEIMPSSDYPMPVGGFPHAWLDRGMEIDPYYGSSGSKNFGILDDLQWRAAQFGTADIEVSAKLSDDEQTVDVTTNLIFPFSDNKANYALEYILVADGLTGPAGSDWDQTNNYAGQNYGSDMAEFQHAGSSVSGLVFNDVAVMMSQTGGIEGSVPTTVKADEPIVNTYTFNLADAVNTSGKNVIQDVNKLRVVALLIDKSEGLVANANKAIVSTPVGIGAISSSDRQAASVTFFDVSGRRQQSLQPGVNIIRYSYADGTSRTVKIVKR